jgi:hypothetical protein
MASTAVPGDGGVNELVQKQRETGEVEYLPTIAQTLHEDVPVVVMPNPEAYSHYDQDPYVSKAVRHALRWLDRHLKAGEALHR